MATFESLFDPNALTRQEQRAFSELAGTLIFDSPVNLKLSRKTVPALAHQVQDEFLRQELAHEQAKLDWVQDAVQKVLQVGAELARKKADASQRVPAAQPEPPQESPPRKVAAFIQEKESVTEAFIQTSEQYLVGRGVDDSNPYNAWGFTPKLAGALTRDVGFSFGKDGCNCFGVVQILGGLYRKMGFDFQMGITVNHPFAIVEVEGKTYLSSLYGVHEAKGTFETHDGYKLYKPSPEDDLPYTLMVVRDFDEALVYELLENFEVLRQMSLGNKVSNLPGTEESGMKIAEQHRGLLQSASWRSLQEKLFPELSDYFRQHAVEWGKEQERDVIVRRVWQESKKLLQDGKSATSYRALPFDTFIEQFVPLAKSHGQAIKNFIAADVELDEEIPADVVLFSQKVKETLTAITEPEVRQKVTERFLQPFTSKGE